MKPFSRLNDICLFVKDVESTSQFYVEKLGLTIKRRQPGYVEFGFADTTLTLWQKPGVFTAIPRRHLGGHGHSFMIAIRVRQFAEVDEISRDLSDRGVEFISKPRTYQWGARAAYFKDNENNIWEIFAWEEGDGPGLAV